MRRILTMLLLSLLAGPALAANAPCDAAVPVKGCRAEARLEGNFVVLTSSTPRCSLIEWKIDGFPKMTTVIDGEERLEVLTSKPEKLEVESCTEVKDLRAIKPANVNGESQPAAEPQFTSYCEQSPIPGARLFIEMDRYWYCMSGRMGITYVWCKKGTSEAPLNVENGYTLEGQRISSRSGELSGISLSRQLTAAEKDEKERLTKVLRKQIVDGHRLFVSNAERACPP